MAAIRSWRNLIAVGDPVDLDWPGKMSTSSLFWSPREVSVPSKRLRYQQFLSPSLWPAPITCKSVLEKTRAVSFCAAKACEHNRTGGLITKIQNNLSYASTFSDLGNKETVNYIVQHGSFYRNVYKNVHIFSGTDKKENTITQIGLPCEGESRKDSHP